MTAFIADLHLTPERPASTRLFEAFLAGAAQSLERLYILGDLFEYWVGDDGAEPLGHEDVEAALGKAVKGGMEIFFMHGNRDFLIGEDFAQRTGCVLLADPVVISLQGRNCLLTHGDALCTDDIEHQNARKEMLSAKWKLAFLKKPLEQRMQTATAMRRQSESSKQTKSMSVMDVNQEAVESLMRQHGVDTLIHGHTHRPAIHQFQLEQKPAWRYVLGDWYEQRSALYYVNGEFSLGR